MEPREIVELVIVLACFAVVMLGPVLFIAATTRGIRQDKARLASIEAADAKARQQIALVNLKRKLADYPSLFAGVTETRGYRARERDVHAAVRRVS